MSEIDFSLEPETTKPSRRYRKGSKFDPVLDAFRKSAHKLVKVEIPGKDANYIRTQLKKRLDAQEAKDILISVTNNVCYMEKVSSVRPSRKGKKGEANSEPEPDQEPEYDQTLEPDEDSEPESEPEAEPEHPTE